MQHSLLEGSPSPPSHHHHYPPSSDAAHPAAARDAATAPPPTTGAQGSPHRPGLFPAPSHAAGGSSSGSGSVLSTPMLLSNLTALSPVHANSANRLLDAGCSMEAVKAIMAMLSAAERDGRLLEEEGRLRLEVMAESPHAALKQTGALQRAALLLKC